MKFQFQSMERKDLLGGSSEFCGSGSYAENEGVEGGDMLIQHALQVGVAVWCS